MQSQSLRCSSTGAVARNCSCPMANATKGPALSRGDLSPMALGNSWCLMRRLSTGTPQLHHPHSPTVYKHPSQEAHVASCLCALSLPMQADVSKRRRRLGGRGLGTRSCMFGTGTARGAPLGTAAATLRCPTRPRAKLSSTDPRSSKVYPRAGQGPYTAGRGREGRKDPPGPTGAGCAHSRPCASNHITTNTVRKLHLRDNLYHSGLPSSAEHTAKNEVSHSLKSKRAPQRAIHSHTEHIPQTRRARTARRHHWMCRRSLPPAPPAQSRVRHRRHRQRHRRH